MIRTPKFFRKDRNYLGEPEGFWKRLVWHYHRKCKKFAEAYIHRNPEILMLGGTGSWTERLLASWLDRYVDSPDVQPLVPYAAIAMQSLVLAPEAVCVTEPPCAPGQHPRKVHNVMEAIEAHLCSHAKVMANSSAVSVNGRIGVPTLYVSHEAAMISDPRFLIDHNRSGLGFLSRLTPGAQEDGIMLFAHGAPNWYHWLIENLPVAFLTLRLPNGLAQLPLVIPASIAALPTFRDSLELFRNGREVVALEDGVHRFKRLIVVDSLVREPMNLRSGFWPDVRDYACNRDLMRQYRSAIIDRLCFDMPHRDKRLFLARAHGRRVYNQSDLLAVAERYGFRAVYPEQLNFRQQVELLASAAFVVGPSGAAFANTLFCQPGTRLLSWLPQQYSDFCSYTNVAGITGSTLRFLEATPYRPIHSSYDAFQAGYHVDPGAFEAALHLALGSEEY